MDGSVFGNSLGSLGTPFVITPMYYWEQHGMFVDLKK